MHWSFSSKVMSSEGFAVVCVLQRIGGSKSRKMKGSN